MLYPNSCYNEVCTVFESRRKSVIYRNLRIINLPPLNLLFSSSHMWASMRENLSSGICEQQRCRPACASAQTDQRLCYSLFRITISRHATREISIFQLVSIAEETGLSLAFSEDLKTGLVGWRPICRKV